MFAAQSAGAGDHQEDRGPGSTREERSHNNECGQSEEPGESDESGGVRCAICAGAVR